MSDYERVPWLVVFPDSSRVRDTYGGTGENVVLQAHLLRAPEPSETVIVFMHPTGGGAYLPMTTALARAGHHVVYCDSRYRGVDSALIMEKVVADLGACIRQVRERFGYRNVVLAGWSGGGSLSAFYQAQAEHPTVTATPAGDPPDLTALDLPPADALMFIAAHVARHVTLTEWLDPAVLDEHDPSVRDRDLDLYDPAASHQPPYTEEYLVRYRAAQLERNRRITAWVKARLRVVRESGRPEDEFGFVVHGTMADPRWLDPSVDPNDRAPGVCYLGDPRVVNMSPVGLARFSTLRSWLSQWSHDDAQADAVTAGPSVSVPVLVVSNTADDACTPSHADRLVAAHARAERHDVVGAGHYYSGPGAEAHLADAVDAISRWLARHGFVAERVMSTGGARRG